MRRAALLTAALVLVATGGAVAHSASDTDRTSLVIRVWPKGIKKTKRVRSATLACRPARGSLPRPGAACRLLLATKEPFRRTPRRVACTEIYGGPAVAHVLGTYKGRRLSRWFNRRNGCEIARWDRVRFLFRAQ